jgi:two-component system, OmpR family, response regulator
MAEDEARILVVDDEPSISDLLVTGLRFVGFDVRSAGTGVDALSVAAEFRPEIVVLDVMLPDVDGFEVCRQLRADGRRVGVVFLTARDATEDKVKGLTIGGDDYVTKPFSLEEVVARVRAVLRRSRMGQHGEATDEVDDGVLRYADLELDEDIHEVRRADNVVDLSPTEFALLRYLMLNAGRVLSKAQILDHVWHYDFGGDYGIVESYISYLRKKVDKFEPPLIHTLRGVGYSLRLPRN